MGLGRVVDGISSPMWCMCQELSITLMRISPSKCAWVGGLGKKENGHFKRIEAREELGQVGGSHSGNS